MSALIAPQIFNKSGSTVGGDFGKALDVGSGRKKVKGFTGFDMIPEADIVHDMNVTPWPFQDNSFNTILMNSSLEHVIDVQKTLEETHRITVPGGRIIIKVPHVRSIDALDDPTHYHYFGHRSMDFFAVDGSVEHYHYSGFKFKKLGFWYGWPHPSKNPLKRLFIAFISRYPRMYDQWLALIIPVKCVIWELEVLK